MGGAGQPLTLTLTLTSPDCDRELLTPMVPEGAARMGLDEACIH